LSVNYVIACWSGMRRVNPRRYVEDRPVFIRMHFERLSKLRHGLDQVTVIVSKNPDEPASYRDFLSHLPERVGRAKVVIMERPNVGYSYGAYSDVFARYGEGFTHYLLMEDDYLFTTDGFDSEMLQTMSGQDRCGFLSFVLADGTREWIVGRAGREAPGGKRVAEEVAHLCPETFKYPRVSVGLMRSAALRDIWTAYGRLPFSQGTNHIECKFEGQFALATSTQKVGWNVGDMLPKYRVRAFGPNGETLNYGASDKPLFLEAAQFLI
jgi:hypothetical protein